MSTIGRISESLIQDILARIDIVELISQSISLKKTGSNFSGLCPFHQEKTPSFTVSATKQFYHCFGCGAHGDSIAFLMEQEGFTFLEALETLSDKVGIALPKSDQKSPSEDLKPLYEILRQAAIFYHKQWKDDTAITAIEYLKQRGIRKEVVKQFALGFAPGTWEALIQSMQQMGISIAQLEKVGLVSKNKQGGFYDRFRNRIIYPIRDIKGRILGFGARVLDDSLPKYLNSPETLVFHKGECLYGLYEAKHYRAQKVLLVEGYMDVIALAQFGIPALASLGTVVTENHLKHIFRYYEHVIFCFDGDEAGKKAAWKACQESLPLKNDVRRIDFMFLPDKEDPDSFIRTRGKDAFLGLMEQALSFSDYFFTTLLKQIPPSNLDNKARFVHTAQPLLQKLPQGVFKTMMLDKLVALKRIEKPVQPPTYPKRVSKERRLKKVLAPAQWLALLLMKFPEWLVMIQNPQRFFTIQAPGIDFLQEVIQQIENNPGCSMLEFMSNLGHRFPQWREMLTAKPWELLPIEALEEEFLGAVQRLEAHFIRLRRENLLKKAEKGELSDEEKNELKGCYQHGN